MEKSILREKYLKTRKNIKNKKEKDTEIFNKIISLKEFQNSKLVLTYVSLNDEVDTLNLIYYCLKNGKQIAVPKCKDSLMDFCYINSISELKEGNFGVLEPQTNNIVKEFENSICIVPGVAFDRNNNRIGFGKGYYDRFLNNYKGTKIGVAYKECICDKIDTDEFDIKLDKVLSE